MSSFFLPRKTTFSETPAAVEHSRVPGLFIVSPCVTRVEEATVMSRVDAGGELRGVRIYGPADPYSVAVTEIPEWLNAISKRVTGLDDVSWEAPSHVVAENFDPGVGHSPRSDDANTFGPTVAIVSMGSTCVMTFTDKRSGMTEDVSVPRRSCVLITGDARLSHTYTIAPRRSDRDPATRCTEKRTRRVALKFRDFIAAPTDVDNFDSAW